LSVILEELPSKPSV